MLFRSVSNTVVASLAVGGEGVAVNPNTNRIYVANNGSSNVSVIDGASNTVAATVAVGTSPEGVAVTPNTKRIYVANWGDDTVSVIEDTPAIPVGGIAEAPDVAGSAAGSSSPPYAALAGAAAGVVALAAGGWYARRRWRAG